MDSLPNKLFRQVNFKGFLVGSFLGGWRSNGISTFPSKPGGSEVAEEPPAWSAGSFLPGVTLSAAGGGAVTIPGAGPTALLKGLGSPPTAGLTPGDTTVIVAVATGGRGGAGVLVALVLAFSQSCALPDLGSTAGGCGLGAKGGGAPAPPVLIILDQSLVNTGLAGVGGLGAKGRGAPAPPVFNIPDQSLVNTGLAGVGGLGAKGRGAPAPPVFNILDQSLVNAGLAGVGGLGDKGEGAPAPPVFNILDQSLVNAGLAGVGGLGAKGRDAPATPVFNILDQSLVNAGLAGVGGLSGKGGRAPAPPVFNILDQSLVNTGLAGVGGPTFCGCGCGCV